MKKERKEHHTNKLILWGDNDKEQKTIWEKVSTSQRLAQKWLSLPNQLISDFF